jgi:hypothetical protein
MSAVEHYLFLMKADACAAPDLARVGKSSTEARTTGVPENRRELCALQLVLTAGAARTSEDT